jgi:prepilin-type processing-associated H-X9-DG protein
LIELLVVVAIISILATLLLPALSNVKHNGHRAACVNNLRQINLALRMYADDWDYRLPAVSGSVRMDYTWATNLFPYVGIPGTVFPKKGIFTCPSTKFYQPQATMDLGGNDHYYLTYGVNQYACTYDGLVLAYGTYLPGGLKRGEDGSPADGATTGNTLFILEGYYHNFWYIPDPGSNLSPSYHLYGYGHFRGRGMNVLLLDGHAEFARQPSDRLKYKLGMAVRASDGVVFYFNVPDSSAGW